MMSEFKKAVLYARVSTGKQAEKDLSIPDQVARVRDYCSTHGYEIVEAYIEPGRSATTDNRPEFQKMMHRVLDGDELISAIIVHSLSRAFRNVEDMILYLKRLRAQKIRLISITQDVDDGPMGRFVSLFYGMVDEMNSAENSKHVKRARRENARRGHHNGSKPPFGYKVVETKIPGRSGFRKILALDEAEAPIVLEIFDLYEGGVYGAPLGMKRIVERLNEKCLYRGNRWRIQLVHRILSDLVYTGVYLFGGRKNKPQ